MSALAAAKAGGGADLEVDSDDEVPQLLSEKNGGADGAAVEEEEAVEDTSLQSSDVTTKYQEAARIAQAALQEVVALCVEGAKILDICKAGDDAVTSRTALIYTKKNKGKAIEKGIAFPVCVSVNEIMCHVSPLTSDESVSCCVKF